jgi:hypothetical protein
VRAQERADEDIVRAHVEFTLMKAGIPWEALDKIEEKRMIEYYAIALVESELEREAILGSG